MTVLVDRPRWAWQGTRWAHLVSDESLVELHRFARRIRMRYLSFQGDHYDLPEGLFDRAVGSGAELVDSRELVRRLRAAGLRNRAGRSASSWRVVGEGRTEHVAPTLAPGHRARAGQITEAYGPAPTMSLLERPGERVALLGLADDRRRLPLASLRVDDDCALVESHDPRGHTLEIVWRSGAGVELAPDGHG